MPNLLAAATSPYLLQHQDNPVAWQEWNEAAFARARAESKPIFLSIGYSTCHWCHVMAHESFENPDVAAVLNEYFVSIKVDREERPDIDRLYMAFVQATTGSGGWPMSVWLTPDGAPFFGGTYFPPTDRYGRPGFLTVLERVAEIWAREPENVIVQSREVIESLAESTRPSESAPDLNGNALVSAYEAFARSYDATHGGFGSGPKFPRPAVFDFLFRSSEPHAREMALHTLRQMAAGGMRDHLGGGFHRYSVDGEWHVPHFEKMLYDQAQLVCSYLEAWQLTGEAAFADIARDTLAYVSGCLTHPEGGFYSAEDADSLFEHGQAGHGEGAFYVWTHEEISRLLDPKAASIFSRHFGIEPGGNVKPETDPHEEFSGKNILIQRESIASTATAIGLDEEKVRKALTHARRVLATARDSRPRPHLDDKILVAWNGLMISAFARAGSALGDTPTLEAARHAAHFLRTHMFDPATGELFRSWRAGRASIRAFAEDYAFIIQGLLDLYEATFEKTWLGWAVQLQARQDRLFFDETTSSYLGSAASDVLLHLRDDYDGAEPAANSVSALNLLRLSWMQHDEVMLERAHRIIGSFSAILRGMPSAIPKMLCALDMSLTPSCQCVLAGDATAADTSALAQALRCKYEPNRVLLLAGHVAGTSGMHPLSGQAALYRCKDFACQAPITDPAQV